MGKPGPKAYSVINDLLKKVKANHHLKLCMVQIWL